MTEQQLEAFAERIRQKTLASISIGVQPEEHGTAVVAMFHSKGITTVFHSHFYLVDKSYVYKGRLVK